MIILHVNKFFDLFGGTETVLHETIAHQRVAGHTVHVFSTNASGNLPSDDARFFVTRYNEAIQEGLAKDVKKGIAVIWNREAKRAIARMLVEIRPDVVHLHNIYHHLSTSILDPIRRAKIPCVQTLHDYKLACPNYRMFTEGSPCERCKGGRYSEAVKHHCLTSFAAGNILAMMEMGFTKMLQSYERTVNVFICPSQFMREKMIAWGEPSSKMMVIPNAVELPIDMAARDGGYFFAAGRLSREKGIEPLLRAMARVPQIHLKIAGTGPEEPRLRSLAVSLGASNVEFLGFVRKAERQDVLSHASALVHPSISYDNAPLTVLEAMAMGLPILGSRIGGIPEQIEEGINGFLVEPGNVEAWADALKRFISLSSAEQSRLAIASRDRAARLFSWDMHLAKIEEAYRIAGAGG